MSEFTRLKTFSGQLQLAAFVCLFACFSGQPLPPNPDTRRLSENDCSCDRMTFKPVNNPDIFTGRVKNGIFVGGNNLLEGELASVAALYVKYPKFCQLDIQGMPL